MQSTRLNIAELHGPITPCSRAPLVLALRRRSRMGVLRQILARWSLIAVAIVATSRATTAQETPAPRGATALCRDGTYSFSRHHSGTCSYHVGVARWFFFFVMIRAPPRVGEV